MPGFEITLPSSRFFRRQGIYSDARFDPAGNPISEEAFAKSVDTWLLTDRDRAYVKSLMKPVYEPGKIAQYMAPPKRTAVDGKPLRVRVRARRLTPPEKPGIRHSTRFFVNSLESGVGLPTNVRGFHRSRHQPAGAAFHGGDTMRLISILFALAGMTAATSTVRSILTSSAARAARTIRSVTRVRADRIETRTRRLRQRLRHDCDTTYDDCTVSCGEND